MDDLVNNERTCHELFVSSNIINVISSQIEDYEDETKSTTKSVFATYSKKTMTIKNNLKGDLK